MSVAGRTKDGKLRAGPTQEWLREWYDYDSQTGIFVWKKVHYTNAKLLGMPAGTITRERVQMNVPKFGLHQANRLVWIYVHGSIPDGLEVDHIDCDSTNNALLNLRLATSAQQKHNSRVRCCNRSGLKGAYYHTAHKGKKWRSQIRVGGRYVFLGYFNTAEEAHAAYGIAAHETYGEFARAA